MSKKKSAVFALPHLMTKNGILSNDSILRIKLSVEIFIKNNLDYIITSGWDYRKDSKKKLGDVVADYLTKNYRIKKENILVDLNSRDTVGDAFFIREKIVIPYKIGNLIVVTSSWHVRRSNIIFEKFFKEYISFKVVGTHSNLKVKKKNLAEELSTKSFYNTFKGVNFKNVEDVFLTLKEKHPHYNGKIHPKIKNQSEILI